MDEVQKRILGNAVRYDILLKYFWVSVSSEELKELEKCVMERRVEEAEREEIIEEIARQMPMVVKASQQRAKGEEDMIRVMDYKTEMC